MFIIKYLLLHNKSVNFYYVKMLCKTLNYIN